MSSVEATIYRALLRAAKAYDKAPILRALLAYEPFQDLPKQERDTFATFLGEKHSFYLPLSEERSVVDAVRREFRSGHGSLDRALVALNTLNRRRSSALKRGLSVDSEPNPVSPDERLTILNKPVRGSVLLSHPMLGGEFDRKAILVLGYHPTKGAYGVALNSPKPAGWYYIFNKPRRNRSNFKEDPVEQPGAGSSAAPQKGESAGEEVGEEHAEHKDASHANTQGDVVPSTEERATLDDFEDFAFDLLSASVDVVERLAEQEGEAGVRALASALGMKKYVAPGQKTNEQMQLKLQQMLLEEMPRTPSVLPPGGEAQDANEFAMAMIKAVCQVVFSLDDDDNGHDEAALAELPTVLTVLSAAPSDMSDSEEGESSDDEEFDDSDAEALLQSVNHAWADAMRLALRHMAIDLRSLLCDAVERHYRGVPQPGRNPIGRQRRSNGKPRNGRPGFTNDGHHEEGHQHEGPEEEEEERPRLVMYGGPIPGEFTFHTVADVRGPKMVVWTPDTQPETVPEHPIIEDSLANALYGPLKDATPNTADEPTVYMGGDLNHAKDMVIRGKASKEDFLFYAGRLSWGPGQLENEIEQGVWIPVWHDDLWGLMQSGLKCYDRFTVKGKHDRSIEVATRNVWRQTLERVENDIIASFSRIPDNVTLDTVDSNE